MPVHHDIINLQTAVRLSFHDVTDQVKAIVARSGVRDGIVVVFSQHTTCSVLIQEDSIDMTYYGQEEQQNLRCKRRRHAWMSAEPV